MDVNEMIEHVGQAVDVAGVALIVIGLIYTTALFLLHMRRDRIAAYKAYRTGLGRTLLLGLEFLVAADIIRTVAIKPTFESVGVLAIIVLIRTFLSWTLERELNQRTDDPTGTP